MKTSMRTTVALGLFSVLAMIATAEERPDKKTPPPSATEPADAARIDRLIRQLGSGDFAEREAANKALEAVGEAALPALRKVQRDSDPEIRRRAAGLISKHKQRRVAMRAKAWERLKEVGDIYSGGVNLEESIGAIQFNHRACDDDLSLLKQFPEAESLEILGPDLTDGGLVHAKNLSKLKMLQIASPKVIGSGFAHLKNLDCLFSMDLACSGVTDEGLVHLKNLKSLMRLDLAGTRITDAGLDRVKEIKALKGSLCLGSTRITNEGLAKLKGMELYRLDLTSTQVTDAGLVHLNEIKNLHHLGLANTAITDAGLPHLKAIPTLERVSLHGTKVSERGKIELGTWLQKRSSEAKRTPSQR